MKNYRYQRVKFKDPENDFVCGVFPNSHKEIVETLINQGVTKSQIARELNISPVSIAHIVHDDDVSFSIFYKLLCFYFHRQFTAQQSLSEG